MIPKRILAVCLAATIMAQSPAALAQAMVDRNAKEEGDPRGLYGDPAHPDLSGYWRPKGVRWADSSGDWPLTEAYGAMLDEHRRLVDAGTPPADAVSECLAFGMPRFMGRDFWAIQTPGQFTLITPVLHEIRAIYTDRGHQVTDESFYGGVSSGRWEGDTLVVQTTNLRAGLIDSYGIHNSDQLKITERFSRPNPNTLRVEITLNDPLAFTKPWTKVFEYLRGPTSERLYEYVCGENNRHTTVDGIQGTVVEGDQ